MRRPGIKPGKEGFLSPSEIIDSYPQLAENLGWTANDIGNLLRMHIVTGTRNANKKITLIHRASLEPVIELVNKNLDRTKVKIT